MLSLRVTRDMATFTINTWDNKLKLVFSNNVELKVYMTCFCVKKIKYVIQFLKELDGGESQNSQLIQKSMSRVTPCYLIPLHLKMFKSLNKYVCILSS